MIQEKQKLSGTLNSKQFLNGSLSNSVIYVDPITQEKTVIPTTDKQIVTPDKNYDGLSKVTINAITLQDKTITPTIEEQIVFSDDNYNGLNKVTVNAVTNEIDENIISENIKNGVDILGVTGNYVGGKYAPRYISFQNYKGTELDSELANLDTSNMTSMYRLFYQCGQLKRADLSDKNTSNVTTMGSMFEGCFFLQTVDLSGIDTSNVTTMGSMFYACQMLTNLDLSNFDTSNVTTMGYMFYKCQMLSNIPKLNASKVTNIGGFVSNCTSLIDFGGLENLGQAYSTTSSANNSSYKLDLSTCTALTEQSLINVLTNLYDIATKGCKTQQVILGSANLAKLTSEEGQSALAQATAYGWTVS